MLQLTALEGQHQGDALQAQFNPKEIVLEQAVLWQRQAHQGAGDLEFQEVEPARLSFELLFDGAQAGSSIQPQIDKLRRFGAVDAVLHRPPKVEVSWGSGAGVMPSFDAVVESVTVRYTMFAENGVPLRATADLGLKQAAHLRIRQT